MSAPDPHVLRTQAERDKIAAAEGRPNAHGGVPTPVGDLAARSAKLIDDSAPHTLDTYFASRVEAAMSKLRVDGIDLAPKDAASKYEDGLREQHDATTSAGWLKLDADLRATAADLTNAVEQAQRAPVEADAMKRDVRELVLVRRLEGRTLSDVVTLFEQTPDAADPVFVNLVESERDRLSAFLRVSPAPTPGADAGALLKLGEVLRDRRASRIPAALSESIGALDLIRGHLRVSAAIRDSRAGSFKAATIRRATKGAA